MPPVPHWMRYNCKTKSFTGLPAVAVFHYVPSRENAKSGSPQAARFCSIQMIFPLNMAKAHAEAITNRFMACVYQNIFSQVA